MFAVMLSVLLAACGAALPSGTADQAQAKIIEDITALDWQGTAIGYSEDEATLQTSAIDRTLTVVGSGADIWNTRDEFYFAYTTLEGDGAMSVRVDDLSASEPWAKAGVMIRESLDPDARNALIHISAAKGSVFQARLTKGAETVNSAGADPGAKAGGWLRLSRAGDTITGELSVDGEDWTTVGSYDIPMDTQVLIGLAVTSHARGASATARFSGFKFSLGTITQPAPKPTPPSDPTPPSSPGSPFILAPATLYVATNGSDSNSGRSAGSPLRTLAKAASVVQPGDVVYIRGGVYPVKLSLTKSGTSSRPIVWASYPGERAILDGSDKVQGRDTDGLWVNGNFNIVANLTVRNAPKQGIIVFGSDNLITGVVSHSNGHVGIQNYKGNRNRFEYLTVYDNYDRQNARNQPGQDADGLQILSGDRTVVSHVVSYNNSDDGIDAWKSTNTIIEYSVSYNNGRGTYGNGNGFKAGGPVDNRNIVRNSIAFNNRSRGFTDNAGRNITFINNTAFNNQGVAYQGGSTTTFKNNLAIGGPLDVSGAKQDHNSWNLGITNARVLSTDPTNSNFLSLAADSPAIDAGADAGYPYNGRAPDLGALEYGVTIADLLGDLGRAY